MAKATTRVLAGVAVAALATAGVAAVVRYRQRQQLEPDEHAQLEELEARLSEVDGPAAGVGRVFENLQRNQGISVTRLRGWIAGLRGETLSPEQAVVAESDFEALEREADQGGA